MRSYQQEKSPFVVQMSQFPIKQFFHKKYTEGYISPVLNSQNTTAFIIIIILM